LISKERATEVQSYYIVHGEDASCRHFQVPVETLNRYLRAYKSYVTTADVTDELPECNDEALVTLEAHKQKLRDLNGVLRKENRESYRLYNTLSTVYDEYVSLLKDSPFAKFEIKEYKGAKGTRYGILHMSDFHMNELIEDGESSGNVFDFSIAAKRLKKYITEAKIMLNAYGVKSVYLFFTGDLINSNRRLSERMASATSQVRASLLATYLIQQVIIELSQSYKVTVAGVVGNESRIAQDDFDSSDVLTSENWDFMIYQQLRMLFAGKPVEFIDSANNTQTVVTLDNGLNALLVHGNFLKGGISDKQIGVLLQGYAYKGIPIHGVFMGHIHSASVGDIVSRSSSLCGGNAYSTNDLMFVSRASQNVYIVNTDKGYHGIKIDLQNTTGVTGYNIIPELERYNVRQASCNTRVTIDALT
jgi:hypothetical protein